MFFVFLQFFGKMAYFGYPAKSDFEKGSNSSGLIIFLTVISFVLLFALRYSFNQRYVLSGFRKKGYGANRTLLWLTRVTSSVKRILSYWASSTKKHFYKCERTFQLRGLMYLYVNHTHFCRKINCVNKNLLCRSIIQFAFFCLV